MTRLDDQHRLAMMRELNVDAPAFDETFDRLTRIARELLGVPVTLVSMVQGDRQVFVGRSGVSGEQVQDRQTLLSHSYCRHAVESGTPFVVEDARLHPLTRENPAIRESQAIAYAGIPIAIHGQVLGTLCAVDHVPHRWTERELAVLKDLAGVAATELRLRDATNRARHETSEIFRTTFEQAGVGMAHVALDGRLLRVNDRFAEITGSPADVLLRMRSRFSSSKTRSPFACSFSAYCSGSGTVFSS